MLVPASRLLWWVSLVGLPFALLTAAEPRTLPFALTVFAALAIFAVADALTGKRRLGDISVQLPPLVRFSKDRAGAIEVRIRNKSLQQAAVRLGLDLPRALRPTLEDQRVDLPAGSEWSRVAIACTPTIRGRFNVRDTYLEAASALGFWAIRKKVGTPCEVRVYPNLLQDRRNLAPLFLRRGSLGAHAQRQIGKGREFEKLREYFPGDSFDEIHWKATARRGRPITKVFQIERTQEIYVILDASRLAAKTIKDKGTGPDTVAPNLLERFITAALVLGLAAEQQGDLFGLATFSDKVDNFVRARNGQAHYSACRDTLYTLQPQVVTPDFDELFSFLRLRLRRRSLLVFLTALDDPALAESFMRNVDLICRQHLLLVNMIQPSGIEPLFRTADVRTEEQIYEQLGGHLAWSNLRELEKVLSRRGVQFSLLRNERLSVELVSQYLAVKKRQLL